MGKKEGPERYWIKVGIPDKAGIVPLRTIHSPLNFYLERVFLFYSRKYAILYYVGLTTFSSPWRWATWSSWWGARPKWTCDLIVEETMDYAGQLIKYSLFFHLVHTNLPISPLCIQIDACTETSIWSGEKHLGTEPCENRIWTPAGKSGHPWPQKLIIQRQD